jgi:hypothetical protein
MTQPSKYLPGLYRHAAPQDGESLRGYLLRLANCNGYAGLSPLLGVVASHLRVRTLKASTLASNHSALGILSRMVFGDSGRLDHFYARNLADEATALHGVRVDNDAQNEKFAQVCPQCLAERGVADQTWDLAPVVACEIHRTEFIERCATCAERILWERPSFFQCHHCHDDLRFVRAAKDSALAEVSGDFGTLAPFRFIAENAERVDEPWDTAFVVLRLLATPDVLWVRQHRAPERFFRDLTLPERRAALHAFAEERDGQGYRLSHIGRHLRGKLRHLSALPGAHHAEQRAALYCSTVDRMHMTFARKLFPGARRSESASLRYPDAAGRPRVIRNESELCELLRIDDSVRRHLRRHPVWPVKAPGADGFDLDDIQRLETFMLDGLMPVERIGQVTGLTELSAVEAMRLLRRIQPDWMEDRLVEVSFLQAVQDRIRDVTLTRKRPSSGLALRDLVGADGTAASAVVVVVVRILAGNLNYADWVAPYTWSDLIVDPEELAAEGLRPASGA